MEQKPVDLELEVAKLKQDIAELEIQKKHLSDEQETLQHMAKIFQKSADPIIIEDAYGQIIDLNEETERMYGWSRDELIGQSIKSMTPPEYHRQMETLLAQFRRGKPVQNIESQRQNRAGERIPILLTFVSLVENNDEITSIAAFHKDIRELKKAEAAIRKAQKLQSLGVLAGSIAHDFNNLLVAVLGHSSVARYKLAEDHPARTSIDKVVHAAEQSAHLTRQLLAYSGGGQFIVQPINLNDIIKANQQLLKTAVPKNIEIRTRLVDSLPVISADASQMQQIVMNLIINAAEAYDEDPGIVTIQTSQQSITSMDTRYWQFTSTPLLTGTYVALEVSDNGKGMSKDVVAKIFDPFFTTKVRGRGLGLAAVLGIVRGHKGGLNIYSEPDNGTTFKLLFPTGEQTTFIIEHHIPRVKLGSGVIVIIDDDELVREAIKDILETERLEVLVAASGQEGLELFQERAKDIDMVLMDLSMPGLSGIELFWKLRQIRKNVPVILTSGYDQAKAVRQFAGRRLAGFLQKPFSASTLIQTISKFVETVE